MSDNTSEVINEQTTATVTEDSKNNETQGTDNQPVYTEKQFRDAMKGARLSGEQRVLKKFDGIDVEHYKTLLEKEESERLSKAKEKSEFEKLLKENAEKFNSKITSLTSELTKIKVDGALINAASTLRAINPEQVSQLVRNAVKLSETGEAEVVDPKTGQTRYTESGDPMTINELVSEFLSANSHFVAAGTPGGGSKSNTDYKGAQVDISKLDMKNPEHRKIYAEQRRKLGIS